MRYRWRPVGVLLLLGCGLALHLGPARAASEMPDAEAVRAGLALVAPTPEARAVGLAFFRARGKADAVPALIQGLRILEMRSAAPDRAAFLGLLADLSGARAGDTWFAWVVWQEAHPEVTPFTGFDAFKSEVLRLFDPRFQRFVYGGVPRAIRIEEILWGGPGVDGIPALTNPRQIPAGEATDLAPGERVFGIEINGDARAYPLRIMNWHEMLNDVIGGVPVSLAYCTLCFSGILYRTDVPGRPAPFTFGSSGLLYRANKLMYDRQTGTLWNQFTGRPVVGPLTGSGIELEILPLAIERWADWVARHPNTRVLSSDTGYDRDYTPGAAYGAYFASPDLMYPARTDDDRLAPKDVVFGVRLQGAQKAWPMKAFADRPVINDAVGDVRVVLIGNYAGRTVRAYEARGHDFTAAERPDRVVSGGAEWRMTESALVGPGGERLARLPGHLAFWFAWADHLPPSPLYGDAADSP